jgi:hypothetical protein
LKGISLAMSGTDPADSERFQFPAFFRIQSFQGSNQVQHNDDEDRQLLIHSRQRDQKFRRSVKTLSQSAYSQFLPPGSWRILHCEATPWRRGETVFACAVNRRELSYQTYCKWSFHGTNNPITSKATGRKMFLALKFRLGETCLLTFMRPIKCSDEIV